ncbi:dienelactone hydrolase family protein [Hyphococcus sp.]|uniref:dienelactone hydrolase family protein n=1 Tax=Hyphococcus sp. TaxID=2038636 RepID=UPI0035C74E62
MLFGEAWALSFLRIIVSALLCFRYEQATLSGENNLWGGMRRDCNKIRASLATVMAAWALGLIFPGAFLPAAAQQPEAQDAEPGAAQDGGGPIAHRVTFSFDGLDDLTVYILRPAELDPAGHKVLLYFVGGGQEDRDVASMLTSNLAREAVKRGFIFVSPVAPCYSCTFVARGEDHFPALFETLAARLPMSEERFHLMGFSNGGRSSLHIGTRHPEWVASITTYPGYLRNGKYELLSDLSKTCVVMYVGEKDASFLARHKTVVRRLKKAGHPVYAKTYRREGHKIDPLWEQSGAELLMDGVENGLGCPEPAKTDTAE